MYNYFYYYHYFRFERAVTANRVVIVEGATGSGKSTQLPQYLADMGMRVACTQPRKLAAEELASRVAMEFSGEGSKSKQVKNVTHIGATTSIPVSFMTEAVLVRCLLAAHEVFPFDVVVLDEAHERNINTDLLLGLLKGLIARGASNNLKLVVTSATLQADKFQAYFKGTNGPGSVPVVKIPGRMFPVAYNYPPIPDSADLVTAAVNIAFDLHANSPLEGGDILVFVAAQADCERAKHNFEMRLKRARAPLLPALVLALYGQQQKEDKDLVFAPPPPMTRKVVFSTNVAETSVTIDGVCMVIDTGISSICSAVAAVGNRQ
jgi:HrpA-like RNA helicase